MKIIHLELSMVHLLMRIIPFTTWSLSVKKLIIVKTWVI